MTSPHEHRPVVALEYSPDRAQITLRPLDVGQVLVTVLDLCLEVDVETVATVTVAAPHSIHVTVADKVQVGSRVLAHVKVFDGHHKVFPTDQLRYYTCIHVCTCAYGIIIILCMLYALLQIGKFLSLINFCMYSTAMKI